MSVNNFQTPKCTSNRDLYGDKKLQTNPNPSITHLSSQNKSNGQSFTSHNVQGYENQQFSQQQMLSMKSPTKQPFSSQQIYPHKNYSSQNSNISQINSPQNFASQQYNTQNQPFQQNSQQSFHMNQHTFPNNQNLNFSYQTNSNVNHFQNFNNQISNQFHFKQPEKSFPSPHQQYQHPQFKNGPIEQKEIKQSLTPSGQQPFYFGNANQQENSFYTKYQQNLQSPTQPNLQVIQQSDHLSNQNILTSQANAQKVTQPFLGNYSQKNAVSNIQQSFNNEKVLQNIPPNQKYLTNITKTFEKIKLTETSQENINTSHNIQSTQLGNSQLNFNNCAFNIPSNPTSTAIGAVSNVSTSTFQNTLQSTTNDQIKSAQNLPQTSTIQQTVNQETQPAVNTQALKQGMSSTSSSSIMTSSSGVPHDSFVKPIGKNIQDEEDDDDDEEEDEDGDNDDLDEDYTTEEDEDEGSYSGHVDYDFENQRFFNDSSTVRSMADKNHQISKKLESSKKQETRSRSASSKRPASRLSDFHAQRQEINVAKVVDLTRERNLIPKSGLEITIPPQQEGTNNRPVCEPEFMACTLNALPNTSALLQKARLPLGLIVHPMKEHRDVAVIKGGQIVRCRLCRMYINPYIVVVDQRKWKCTMCSRFNELPADFLFDSRIGQYTNGEHRTELTNASYEIIAPPEYAIRPPQPPIYIFLLDVSFNALDTGYLKTVCEGLKRNIDELISTNENIKVSFLTFNSHIHLYNFDPSLTQPIIYHMVDIEDVQVPVPEGLVVPLKESKSLVMTLLSRLPKMFHDYKDTGNCFGSAVKAALSLMGNQVGRVTAFQTKLPDVGEGSLKSREDPNKRAADTVENLSAVTDFYKNIALTCSSTHVCFDIFMLNSQYADLATISTLSHYSGGCLYYFPNYHVTQNVVETQRLEKFLDRYFTRPVGFEAVLRIRCTRGLSLQLFHGVGFVRSLDLLALPHVTADTSYAVQLSIDNQLNDSFALIQAALLYTNTKCERRIRVHTLYLPVTAFVNDLFVHANTLAIVSLVSKMAVDRAHNSSVADSREACINVASDMLNAYSDNLTMGSRTLQLPCSYLLRSLPLYMLALIKSVPFRLGISTKLDDRTHHMELFKTLPMVQLLPLIHPFLYPVHFIYEENCLSLDGGDLFLPPVLPLSAGSLSKNGAFLFDNGCTIILWVFPGVSTEFLSGVLGCEKFSELQNGLFELPELENDLSENLRLFVEYLNYNRPYSIPLILFRDDSRDRTLLYERLIEDRTSDSCDMSYQDFLRYIINVLAYNS